MPRYYLAVLKSLAPVLIRRRNAPQGTEGFEHYIPGSSLAAAFARALGLRGGYELVAKGFSVSHAYPVRRVGNRWLPSMPAPSVSLRIKNIGVELDPSVVTCPGADAVRARSVMQSYWESVLGFPVTGLVKEVRLGTPLVVTQTRSVALDGIVCHSAVLADVEAGVARDSVAVNPYRGTAEREMLFTYFALPEGTVFWVTLSLPDDVEAPVEEPFVLWIGGARSRGYGRAVAVITEYALQGVSGSCEKLYLWSHAVPRHPARARAELPPGWSRAMGPRMAVPTLPPGAIVHASMLLGVEQGACDAARLRFWGVLPPTGHVEPVDPPSLPRSYGDALRIVEQLMHRLQDFPLSPLEASNTG